MTLGKDGVTTGASNDIKRATELSRNFVAKWGLSEKMGPLLYDEDTEEVFLGRSAATHSLVVSSHTALQIEEEVRKLVDGCYSAAEKILQDNIDKLHSMSEALMKYETIDSKQIDNIMAGEEPGAPSDWHDDSSDGDSSEQSHNEKKTARSTKGPIGGPAGQH